jgi:hypothetical protein
MGGEVFLGLLRVVFQGLIVNVLKARGWVGRRGDLGHIVEGDNSVCGRARDREVRRAGPQLEGNEYLTPAPPQAVLNMAVSSERTWGVKAEG